MLYEPPNPSKGFNFFNFKPLKEDSDGLNLENLDKTSIKRENQVNPDKTGFTPENPINGQISFPSFFNSQAIDDELKTFQEKLETSEQKENREKQILFKKIENSIDFENPVEVFMT
jgi:hypothetical protein